MCDANSLSAGHNICPIDEGGFRDPYVRLLLSPEVDNRKRETSIHRGETHPYFNQHFRFPISRDQLPGKELVLQVLDCDRYSYNDIVGEVRLCIDDLDVSKSTEVRRHDKTKYIQWLSNNLLLLFCRCGAKWFGARNRPKIGQSSFSQ